MKPQRGGAKAPSLSRALYHKKPNGASMETIHIILDVLQTAGLILLAWIYYRKYKDGD